MYDRDNVNEMHHTGGIAIIVDNNVRAPNAYGWDELEPLNESV